MAIFFSPEVCFYKKNKKIRETFLITHSLTHYHRFAVVVRRGASQLGVHYLGAHGFSTERARLAGGTWLHTAQVHTASAQNVQDQPGALRFARGFKKSACYLLGFLFFFPKKVATNWWDLDFSKKAAATSWDFDFFSKKVAATWWDFYFFSSDFET